MLTKPKSLFLSLFLLLPGFSAFSQHYQINDVEYSLEKTRESDLKRKVDIDTKKIFQSQEELNAYLKDLYQRLMNTRAFESVEIINSQDDTNFNSDESNSLSSDKSKTSEELIQISLKIQAKDSKHLVILPYPKYDSNEGLIFKIKAKDVNFLGTLNTLDAGIYGGIKEDAETGNQNPTFGLEFNYSYPFSVKPFAASWNNNAQLQYTAGVNILEFWTGTGFTFELPFNRFSLVYDIKEEFNRDTEYEEFDDVQHFRTISKFSIPIKVFDINDWGYIYWIPFTQIKVSYDKNGIDSLNDDLAGPVLSAGHSLKSERINWHDNFRSGLKAEITQELGWDFQQEEIERKITGQLQLFKAFKYIGFNTRFIALISKSNRATFGEYIRGVRDKQKYLNDIHKALKSPSALILNLDLPFHLVTTDWVTWGRAIFGEESWFTRHFLWTEKFNFEMQLSPFMDFALTKNEFTDRLFDYRDGWYTGGFEILIFPQRWKGIVVRGSFGLDLGRAILAEKFTDKIDMSWREDVKKYEIYAGIGLHY